MEECNNQNPHLCRKTTPTRCQTRGYGTNRNTTNVVDTIDQEDNLKKVA